MVYQWTNFVWETNAWWLRRARPLILAPPILFMGYYCYRYYFFGKLAALKDSRISHE